MSNETNVGKKLRRRAEREKTWLPCRRLRIVIPRIQTKYHFWRYTTQVFTSPGTYKTSRIVQNLRLYKCHTTNHLVPLVCYKFL